MEATARAAAALAAAGHDGAARSLDEGVTADGPDLADLDLAAALAAAEPLAEAVGFDPEPVAAAVAFARRDLEATETGSPFVPLVWDFVREADRRPLIHRRLVQHVERRRARVEDVDGLF